MNRTKHFVGALLVILAVLAMLAQPASAQNVLVQVETNTRMLNCGSTSDPACTIGSRSLPAGRTVKPICSISGDKVGGRGWAFSRTVTGSEGFVPIVRLESMPSVPHCSKVPRVMALLWALDRYGDQTGPTPTGIWSGYCQSFATAAWEVPTAVDVLGGPSAIAVATAYGPRLSLDPKIPAGAIMYWDVGTDGHAAISLGRGGQAVGTVGVGTAARPISIYDTSIYPGYMGWVLP